MTDEKKRCYNILFVSKLCSDDMYKVVVGERTKASLDPSQRLFSAVVAGLKENGCNVTCISARPFSINNTKREYFDREEETKNGIKYIYPSFHIAPLRRMLDLYKYTKTEIKKWVKDNNGSNSIVICDSLIVMCSFPARKIARASRIKCIAYVTDYPSLATSIKGKQNLIKSVLQKAFDSFADCDLNKYDGYILVSKYLSELIKINNKPSVVVEDVIITNEARYEKENVNEDFTVLYGGALCERFGVNKLADTMEYIDDSIKMVFYGSGESVPYILEKEKNDNRIHYGGVLPFDKLQIEQRRADILVNPRPSNETFAKYSFPSKTLSYMLSGTPVLTTKIPGIPDEYYKYIYLFDEEDVESMANAIKKISSIPKLELKRKGLDAFEYAMNFKNPLYQGLKIVNFLSSYFDFGNESVGCHKR